MTGSHLTTEKRTTKFDRTPSEWLPFGKQVADQCNTWAGRGDIVAFVGKGAVQDDAGNQISIACFRPNIAEMEIAVDLAFGEGVDPGLLGDFTERDTHFDYPEVTGAVYHEAMHAKHSLFDLAELGRIKDRRIPAIVMWFEETRIEARGVELNKKNRSFLRACALKFVVPELTGEKREEFENSGAMGVSMLCLLALARVDAGVLTHADVEGVRELIEAYFGSALLEELQKIWLKAQGHRKDHSYEELVTYAEEWLKLLEDNGHKTEPSEEEKEQMRQFMKALADAAEEAAEESGGAGMDEAMDQSQKEAREEQAGAANKKAEENKEAKEQFADVFGKSTGPSDTPHTRSRLERKRDPEPKERAAAVRVAKMLEKARYQDRVITQTRSELPPGRLSGRAAMQRQVQRDRGQRVTAEPWKHKQRRHVEDPELLLGMMTDISGSMSSAMVPMAVSAWLMSEAGKRVQARVASVYYGNDVFPVLKPGQHLDKVTIYTAPDGTEKFNKAFKALNGALNLLNSSGARLLVVTSDFCYTPDEQDAARKWIKRCDAEGVAVLILDPTGYGESHYIEHVIRGTHAKVVSGITDPADSALEIGTAAAEALTRVSAARNGG